MSEGVKGLYGIIPLRPFRKTPGVVFDIVPEEILRDTAGIDRVIHSGGAVSPGPVGDVERPWYMHPCQRDRLLVLHGVRYAEIYTPAHGKVEKFDISPEFIKKNGETIHGGPAMLVWPPGVFHRIQSDHRTGSASINFAIRDDRFDADTNFNIYDVDTGSGECRTIREGYLDQE